MPAFGKPWDLQDMTFYVLLCYLYGGKKSCNFLFFMLQQCITSHGHKEDQRVPERSSGHHMDLPQPTVYNVWCKLTHTHSPVVKAVIIKELSYLLFHNNM